MRFFSFVLLAGAAAIAVTPLARAGGCCFHTAPVVMAYQPAYAVPAPTMFSYAYAAPYVQPAYQQPAYALPAATLHLQLAPAATVLAPSPATAAPLFGVTSSSDLRTLTAQLEVLTKVVTLHTEAVQDHERRIQNLETYLSNPMNLREGLKAPKKP
jgi:hypothetical protein